jgi:hypothetical protein
MKTPVLDEVDDTSILKTGRPARYRRSLSWVPRQQIIPTPQRSIAERFRPLARSDGLGRATVLPQSKVKRLSAAVDGTADFDPTRTLASPDPHHTHPSIGVGLPRGCGRCLPGKRLNLFSVAQCNGRGRPANWRVLATRPLFTSTLWNYGQYDGVTLKQIHEGARRGWLILRDG